MNKDGTILLIEDEKDIAGFIELELKCEGYKVHISNDGLSGLMAFRQLQPDLVILDIMLPQMDGLEICKRIRQSSDTPIILLTAKDTVIDKINGLDSGANDYIVKPFNLEELTARVRVQLRTKKPFEKVTLEYLDMSINLKTREVKKNNKNIILSPKEYELLKLFMQTPKQVVTKDKIIESVWGLDFEGDENILEVYIHSLREKLEAGGADRILHNVRGVGYVIKENNENKN